MDSYTNHKHAHTHIPSLSYFEIFFCTASRYLIVDMFNSNTTSNSNLSSSHLHAHAHTYIMEKGRGIMNRGTGKGVVILTIPTTDYLKIYSSY